MWVFGLKVSRLVRKSLALTNLLFILRGHNLALPSRTAVPNPGVSGKCLGRMRSRGTVLIATTIINRVLAYAC